MVLIGRQHELAVLGDALQRASVGETARLLIEGPLGSGTTSLLDELQTRLAGMPAVLVRQARAALEALEAQQKANDAQIDLFAEDGYSKEEIKMANETRKILHAPDIAISATCVRIPTFFGHAMNVWAEFERPLGPAEARDLMATAAGVRLVDDPGTAEDVVQEAFTGLHRHWAGLRDLYASRRGCEDIRQCRPRAYEH